MSTTKIFDSINYPVHNEKNKPRQEVEDDYTFL